MKSEIKILQPGTVVFTAFAILSVFVFIFKGLVPLYFIEAFLWAGLAALWHVKQITSKVANYTVLFLALAVLLGNSFNIGRAAGYKAGYGEGSAAGHAVGYKEGKLAGLMERGEDELSLYLSEEALCTSGKSNEQQFPVFFPSVQHNCDYVDRKKAKFNADLAQKEIEFRASVDALAKTP
jgi:hypothetical protein